MKMPLTAALKFQIQRRRKKGKKGRKIPASPVMSLITLSRHVMIHNHPNGRVSANRKRNSTIEPVSQKISIGKIPGANPISLDPTFMLILT